VRLSVQSEEESEEIAEKFLAKDIQASKNAFLKKISEYST
jgi:hypothetical protein